MRKLVLLAFVLLVPLVPSSASAHANCPSGWSHHHGTNSNDDIHANGGGPRCWYLLDGRDDYHADNETDFVEGGNGDDLIVTGGGQDWVSGGSNDDEIWGEASGDFLYGDGGGDTITGGNGADDIAGNGGADKLFADNDDTTFSSFDEIFDGDGSDVVTGDPEDNLYLCQDGTSDNLSNFFGTVYGPATAYCDPANPF